MKIEIELTEEDAACIWTNNWGEKNRRSVKDIVQELVTIEANDFRRNFPTSVESAVRMFHKANSYYSYDRRRRYPLCHHSGSEIVNFL
jgi:hypothetical protein